MGTQKLRFASIVDRSHGKARHRRYVDMKTSKSSDPWAVVTIALSVGLFVLAVFVKGLTHELLLEAGVFLVSVKLILMAKKNTETEERLEQRLATIQEMLAAKN
jgi:protein-S-isoprenylcysteine O-methyltransferase Ste14